MKKWIAMLLCLLLALPMAGVAEEAQTLAVTDYLAAQADVDAMLMAECAAGYAFESPLVVLNPYGNAPLSAVAVFSTEEAVGGTVTVKGKAPEDDIVGQFDAATEHYVPIYGLYAGEITQVEIALDDGRTATVEVETEALDLGLKDYQTEMLDASLYDYGMLTVCGNMILHCYAGYDSKGDLRWALTGTGANAITRMENGHFLIPNIYGHGAEFPNGLTGIREIDPLGKVYNTYVWNGGEHHEIIVLPNGNYLITGSRPGYATNRDYVFEIDPASGEVVWDLDMAAVITPGSSGCESDQGQDWCHNNALAYDEATDTLLISCRHLCAVVAVEKSTKALKWILGDPAGWSEAYAPYLLDGGEGFEYAYGQHQLTLLGDNLLLMFDNGEFGRVKMVNADRALEDADNYSRAVIYRIDPEAMAVEQVWDYGKDLGAECYAGSMSGVQCLDAEKGRYLLTFGTCVDAEGETATHIQLIENDACYWQMDYRGSSTYRGYRYPLYGGIYTPDVAGAWRGYISETEQLSGIAVDTANASPAPEGVQVTLFPFGAVRFSGGFTVPADVELPDYVVALAGEVGEPLCFDLGYNINNAQDGVRVNLSRWVSLKGIPAGEYHIYIVGDGTFDTGKTVTVE